MLRDFTHHPSPQPPSPPAATASSSPPGTPATPPVPDRTLLRLRPSHRRDADGPERPRDPAQGVGKKARAQAPASSENSRWSSSTSIACRRAVSIMNSVRVLPSMAAASSIKARVLASIHKLISPSPSVGHRRAWGTEQGQRVLSWADATRGVTMVGLQTEILVNHPLESATSERQQPTS